MVSDVEAARSGDLAAFARLVEAHHTSVCAITTAILGDPVAGEDAAQEAFLSGWRKLGQLDAPERFPAWLCQIARNTARGHRRSARRRPDRVVALSVDVPDGTSAERALEDAEHHAVLATAVAELPEDVREVLVLYYRDERSTAEVARRLGLTEVAVRKRLSRARETLKVDVEERFGGWMERTRPGSRFVAGVVAAVAALGLSPPARAATRRLSWAAGSAAVVGAVALAVWTGSVVDPGSAAPRVAIAVDRDALTSRHSEFG